MEAFLLTSGWHKNNVSKHDYIYGSAKLSIDTLFSAIILLIAILTLAMLLGCDNADAPTCECCTCCDCDPHTVDACQLNGHFHCDCWCGENERAKHTKYEHYKRHLET